MTILYQGHVINIHRSEATKSIISSIDNELVDKFPRHLSWMRMEKLAGERVSVLLLAIQVSLTDDVDEFGLSWLVNKLVPDQLEEEYCQVVKEPECDPVPAEEDTCTRIMDSDVFKVRNKVFFLIVVHRCFSHLKVGGK